MYIADAGWAGRTREALMVLALTAVIFTPTMLFPVLRRYTLPGAFAFAVLFGWATPWLAQAG